MILLHIIGLPAFTMVKLFQNRVAVLQDQTLRMHGEGGKSDENPWFDFRSRYHTLYSRFHPDYYYWRLVIFARKMIITWISIGGGRARPGVQATLA